MGRSHARAGGWIWSVALAVAMACTSSGSSPHDEAVVAPGSALIATLEPPAGPMRAREAKLVYTIENRGAQAVMLPRDEMGSAILVLAVHDAAGQARYSLPPGQPPVSYKRREEELKPGQTWRFELSLAMFSPELAPGTYTARLRSGHSNVVSFTIR